MNVPTLRSADVHVWRVDLRPTAAALEGYAAALSASEQERERRFREPRARAAFVVTRAVLRQLLASYLDCSARSLRFAAGPHGKPFLAGHHGIHFNVSHSRDRALLAFAAGGPVGIDIEWLDPTVDVDHFADRFFSPVERAALRALAHEQRRRAFFACWTRKEAYVKALGSGLSHDLAAFDVTLAPGRPAELAAPDSGRWELADINAPGPYAAAIVATRAPGGLTIQLLEWGSRSPAREPESPAGVGSEELLDHEPDGRSLGFLLRVEQVGGVGGGAGDDL